MDPARVRDGERVESLTFMRVGFESRRCKKSLHQFVYKFSSSDSYDETVSGIRSPTCEFELSVKVQVVDRSIFCVTRFGGNGDGGLTRRK